MATPSVVVVHGIAEALKMAQLMCLHPLLLQVPDHLLHATVLILLHLLQAATNPHRLQHLQLYHLSSTTSHTATATTDTMAKTPAQAATNQDTDDAAATATPTTRVTVLVVHTTVEADMVLGAAEEDATAPTARLNGFKAYKDST